MVAQVYGQKLEKVTVEMLEAKNHPVDSTASAAYLHHNTDINFDHSRHEGIYFMKEVVDRIKIYDQKGIDYANYSIVLRSNTTRSSERLLGISATSYNMVDGKIVKTKLKKKDIYKEKGEGQLVTKFAVPSVKVGTIIDVKYTVKSPFIYTIPTWYFQYDIPVDNSQYNLVVHPYLVYTPISKGTTIINREKDVVSSPLGRCVRYRLLASDVPAIKKEPYVLTMDDFRSSIGYEIYETNFPHSLSQNYSKNWKEIGDNILDLSEVKDIVTHSLSAFKEVIAEAKEMEVEDRIRFLYSHVQNNYSWNKYYGYPLQSPVKKLLKDKTGNAATINLLLYRLLQKADVIAYPFAIRSRYIGLLNEHYPSLANLNYILVYIPLSDGNFRLLDASSKYIPFGQLPSRAINVNGLLIKEGNSIIVNTRNPNIYSVVSMTTYDLKLNENALVGSGKKIYSNYGASNFRIKLDDKEEDEDVQEEAEYDAYANNEDDSEIAEEGNKYTETKLTGVDDINAKIIQEFEARNTENIQRIGDKYFIDAVLDNGIESNPFTANKREFAVFYDNLVNINKVITIDYPENMIVESMPEPLHMRLPEGIGSYNYTISTVSNKLNINFKLKIGRDIITPDHYEALKRFYNLIMEKQSQKIVLTTVK